MKVTSNILLLILLVLSQKVFAQSEEDTIGDFTTLSDIGSPRIEGTVKYSAEEQVYTLSASGKNIWYGEDSFSMLWKEMKGDFIVQTKIEFIGEGHEAHRKTGIMFRSSADEDAPMVACTVHGDGLTSLQYRIEKGADVQEIKMDLNGPDVLQLEKKGTKFIMSVAKFGELYQVAEISNPTLINTLMAGIYVCSHTNEFAETVRFTNTRVFVTAPDDLVQYQTYLTSKLEVLEVETGKREVVASSKEAWQAPNWSPDGEMLMYNSGGLLYNFILKDKQSVLVATDFADKNNNDHVLSPDGKQIAISHHAQEANGASLVYTVPSSGGIPKKVTEKGPSYLHAWSPDAKKLLYTAERNGDYDIYEIPAAGGEEKRLTEAKGLDDGSEYSTDEKYIYFCSTRSGSMNIWRMDADGANKVQLTSGELNDWFPHVSPDGKWLAFITFPKEVPADKHPFYERVYLRLMPVEGGPIKTIGYLYGGQGSFNVPSWSPDSKYVAFISNGIF